MDELRELAWEYAASRKFPEDLPMAAALALARGIDSPALRELAGLGRRSDTSELHSLFTLALEELQLPMPSPEQAARRDLHRLARDLVAGRRSPRDVARACYFADAWMNQDESDFVNHCCYFDDMIEHIPADQIPKAEAAFVEAARAVVGSDTDSK
jgi:hypothetical protein